MTWAAELVVWPNSPHQVGHECSFYEDFALRGIRVDRVTPASFLVPSPCLLASLSGKLATRAIANLVDEVGGAVVQKGGYAGTVVLVKNKQTGELIAEGRHSLFGKLPSEM
ncbi:unnamed protein product [Linum tenue]|uniref:Uncharacterized protein n=1 Tax=Linum tenue TaxID=586396 RepID=A0AAV0Q6U9_9ROSI|nr:unnamed protein product [Linum tenue]